MKQILNKLVTIYTASVYKRIISLMRIIIVITKAFTLDYRAKFRIHHWNIVEFELMFLSSNQLQIFQLQNFKKLRNQ